MNAFRATVGALVVLLLSGSLALAQTQPKKKVAEKNPGLEMKQCESNYKNCVDTRKVVTDAIAGVKKGEQWSLITKEIADAELWLRKADERVAGAKAVMDKGGCDAEVLNDLGTAWRWLVEAGSAAMRASIAQANGYGKKEK